MNFKSWILSFGSCALVLVPNVGNAAVKIGNLTRANKAQAYQQINESRYRADLANQQAAQAAVAAVAPQELPIAVHNQELAQQIQSGDAQAAVSMAQLDKCAKIYPNGEFAWAKPTAGRGAGGANTCVAVVEMRAAQAGPNGEDLVVARANVAAGDSLNCNISAFPQITWLPDAGNVEFPADAEPTREDVIAVMNEEQKQHAGLKILAGGLVSAIAGNAMGENDPGKDGLFGTSKSKLKTTAIGALGGAGLMAASSFGGKVGGDMIMSAGVNAAAGALIGNMSGKGDSVLRVERCTLQDGTETTCAYALLSKVGDDIISVMKGNVYVNVNEPDQYLVCDGYWESNGCYVDTSLINPEIRNLDCSSKNGNDCTYDVAKGEKFEALSKRFKCYVQEDANKEKYKLNPGTSCGDGTVGQGISAGPWLKLDSIKKRGNTQLVMLVGVEDKAFGWKIKDFNAELKSGKYNANKIVGRDANGTLIDLTESEHFKGYVTYADVLSAVGKGELNFQLVSLDADDGGLIDLNNKARMKSTLVGAGAGAGLGAFTAYQGAQSEIEERLVSAIREYKDSLNTFYCITGKRLLSTYNDPVVIPVMPE